MKTYVKFYSDRERGEVSVETNALDFVTFMAYAGLSLQSALLNEADESGFTAHKALAAVFNLGCKLKGYKADHILEQRVLVSGGAWPTEASLIGSSGGGEQDPEAIIEDEGEATVFGRFGVSEGGAL